MADDKIDYIQQRLDMVVDKVHEISSSVSTLNVTLENHTKQDEHMYSELKRNNDILNENTASLKDHMYRTDLLEEFVKKQDARFSPIERDFMKRKTVREHRLAQLKFIAKLGAAAGAIGSIGMALKVFIQSIL